VTVIGDASVFIALQRIGEMELLARLYRTVHVPDAVWREVFLPSRPGAAVEAPVWIVRHVVARSGTEESWPETLDPGETEAILLCQELAADLLLIDDSAGRRVAQHLGLNVAGVVGVLLDAKRRGQISQVKPMLDRLRESGFWLANRLLEDALRRANEYSEPPRVGSND